MRVQIKGDDAHAIIDARSVSRYGWHDLGTNAARIRALLAEVTAALEKGDDFVAQMVERCRSGGELVFQRLSALPRVKIARPEAAFYSFFSVDGVDDTLGFCKKLAKDYKVGLAPGEAFAAGGQGNIRLCFASGAERLSRGLDRIEAAIKAL